MADGLLIYCCLPRGVFLLMLFQITLVCFFFCLVTECLDQFWGPFEYIFAILDDLGKAIAHAMKVTAQVCSPCLHPHVYHVCEGV